MTGLKRSNNTGVLTSGESISYWLDTVKPLEFETLSGNLETDILIIGAGIAGLTTAYLLSKSGRKINGPATANLESLQIKHAQNMIYFGSKNPNVKLARMPSSSVFNK